jgi:hypothetical protein
VSLNGGRHWAALKGNMPPAPVFDLTVHPREGDLVVGTYGRGIWVTDITPLRELNDAMLNDDAWLFRVRPKAWRREGALGNYHLYGDRHAVTPNEPNGLSFTYYLKEQTTNTVTIAVADAAGKVVRTLNGTSKPGMNRVAWSSRSIGQFDGPADANRQPLAPGNYTATLRVGDRTWTQPARVLEGPMSESGGEKDTDAAGDDDNRD